MHIITLCSSHVRQHQQVYQPWIGEEAQVTDVVQALKSKGNWKIDILPNIASNVLQRRIIVWRSTETGRLLEKIDPIIHIDLTDPHIHLRNSVIILAIRSSQGQEHYDAVQQKASAGGKYIISILFAFIKVVML